MRGTYVGGFSINCLKLLNYCNITVLLPKFEKGKRLVSLFFFFFPKNVALQVVDIEKVASSNSGGQAIVPV